MDLDEALRAIYAACEHVKNGVGEIEIEESTGEDTYMRVVVRREPVESQYSSVNNFGEGWQNEDEE